MEKYRIPPKTIHVLKNNEPHKIFAYDGVSGSGYHLKVLLSDLSIFKIHSFLRWLLSLPIIVPDLLCFSLSAWRKDREPGWLAGSFTQETSGSINLHLLRLLSAHCSPLTPGLTTPLVTLLRLSWRVSTTDPGDLFPWTSCTWTPPSAAHSTRHFQPGKKLKRK